MSKTIEEIKDEVAQELGYKSKSVFSAHEQLLINPHGCNYKVLSSSFDQVAERYAQSQNQEIIVQNRELVANIQLLLQSLDYDALGVMSGLIIEDLKELLTKYQKP